MNGLRQKKVKMVFLICCSSSYFCNSTDSSGKSGKEFHETKINKNLSTHFHEPKEICATRHNFSRLISLKTLLQIKARKLPLD